MWEGQDEGQKGPITQERVLKGEKEVRSDKQQDGEFKKPGERCKKWGNKTHDRGGGGEGGQGEGRRGDGVYAFRLVTGMESFVDSTCGGGTSDGGCYIAEGRVKMV